MAYENIVDRAQLLNSERAQGQISTFDHLLGVTELWAEQQDNVQAVKTEPSNLEIAQEIMSSETQIKSAFDTGYDGQNYYPLYVHHSLGRLTTKTFDTNIFTANHGTSRRHIGKSKPSLAVPVVGALNAITDHKGVANVEKLPAAEVPKEVFLAGNILAAHTVYKYIHERITEGFRNSIAERGSLLQLKPGFEEKFWQSRILGAPKYPGIYESAGTLSRLIVSVEPYAVSAYGSEVNEYMNAWWDILNVNKPRLHQNYHQTMQPVITALLSKNLSLAKDILQVYRKEDDRILPQHPSVRLGQEQGKEHRTNNAKFMGTVTLGVDSILF